MLTLSPACLCADCRQRRRPWWSCVLRLCLWGACLRSPVSALPRWFNAVKDCWSSAPPTCKASRSVFLTSTLSCKMETCVSPGTGRADLQIYTFLSVHVWQLLLDIDTVEQKISTFTRTSHRRFSANALSRKCSENFKSTSEGYLYSLQCSHATGLHFKVMCDKRVTCSVDVA